LPAVTHPFLSLTCALPSETVHAPLMPDYTHACKGILKVRANWSWPSCTPIWIGDRRPLTLEGQRGGRCSAQKKHGRWLRIDRASHRTEWESQGPVVPAMVHASEAGALSRPRAMLVIHRASKEGPMLVAQGGLAGLQSLDPVILLCAIAAVLFWRIVLRILAIVLVVLLVSGVILIVQDMHRFVR
jgi:hypothetical protein